VLEFYSGIGGMVCTSSTKASLFGSISVLMVLVFVQRYSLMKAQVNAEVVEAFEINDTANDVYQHNFGHRPFQVCFVAF